MKSTEITADVFKALGDPTRLKILKLIVSRENRVCVGMIAKYLNISQPAVSQHLKVLKIAGIVEALREGFHMHYSVCSTALKEQGIDIFALLDTFGSELDFSCNCHHHSGKGNCHHE